MCLILLPLSDVFSQVTCTASGNWTTATWSPAAPVAGQNITISAGCTLTVDVSTPVLNNLVINGAVIVSPTAGAILNMTGDLTINSTGSLTNNGAISFQGPGRAFNMVGNATYLHNPLNNSIADELIFSNSNESFSPTSNLEIRKWNDPQIPLGDPTRIQSSSFGNLTLSAAFPGNAEWIQKGWFALPVPNRIQGNFVVTAGRIIMDEGAGNTVTLTLGDVEISGTGSVVFQRGPDRNLTLNTGSFTVSSSLSSSPTVMLDTSMGILTWTAAGSVTLGNHFNALLGNSFESGGDVRISVLGNLGLTGGNIVLVKRADAPCRLTVSGTTTFNDPTGTVGFVEGASGALTFTTNDLFILSGTSNYFLGLPGASIYAKGAGNISVNNDCLINGSSSTCVAWSDSNVSKVRFVVGRDFNMNNSSSTFTGSNIQGAFTFKATRNFNFYGGRFIAQANTNNSSIDSLIVGGDFYYNSPIPNNCLKVNRGHGNTYFQCLGNFNMLGSGNAYGEGFIGVDSSTAPLDFRVSGNLMQNGGKCMGILSGSGNLTMSIAGMCDINQGTFLGFSNTIYSNAATVNFTAGSIDYDGGLFSVYQACNNTSAMATVSVSGACKVNFTSASDRFTFLGLTRIGTDESSMSLNLTIGGLFTIQGVNGTFVSSLSGASSTETLNLTSWTISGGVNSLNSELISPFPNGHPVTATLTGSLTVLGGNTYLSAKTNSISFTVNGDVNLTAGDIAFKGGDITGTGTFTVKGGYYQSGGNFYMHRAVSDTLNNGAAIAMVVNSDNDATGDFSQTAGTLWFDNCSGTPASYSLTLSIRSPQVTLGSSGRIIQSNPSNYNAYGQLQYIRAASTILFNRISTHRITNIKQTVASTCTLDVATGDLQLCSTTNNLLVPDLLIVQGVLDLRTNRLFSDALNMYSGVLVIGRVRTAHPNGLYNATVNAAFSSTLADSLDYYLSTTSYIEYNGTDNQVVSGVGLGRARKTDHKYGNLEINFTGTPNVEYVYPTNLPNDSSVNIRGSLLLTNGEFNLDNDHTPSNSGGRMITLESATSAMNRTAGYLRSETYDGSARLRWTINTSTLSKVVQWGYSSAEYLPLTYTNTAGTSGNVYFSTYRTPNTNLPLPPTVNHLQTSAGVVNTANTADRFWQINPNGSANVTATIDFKAAPIEITGLTSLKAQRWVVASNAWTNPLPGTQTSTAQGTTVVNPVAVSQWWTLTGNNSPLPVELLYFDAACINDIMHLTWATASEMNNSHFTVKRSYDGVSFELIHTQPGAGNSSQLLEYSLVDESLQSREDQVYYELSQFDFDGVQKTYPVLATRNCNTKPDMNLIVMDGPNGRPILQLEAPHSGNYNLEVISVSGALLYSEAFVMDPGTYRMVPELPHLAPAVYLIRWYGQGGVCQQKWLKRNP